MFSSAPRVVASHTLASRSLFVAFAALMFLVPLYAPTAYSNGPVAPDLYKALLLQVGMFVLLACWCIIHVNQRDKNLTITLTNWHLAICALLVWCALSLFWSFHLNLAQIAVSRWLIFGAVFLLATQLLTDMWRVQVLLVALWLAGLCVAIIGICQFLDIAPLNKLFLQAAPPAATFGNRNMAMHFIVLTLPLSWWFFIVCKEQWQVFCAAIGSALMVTHMIYSGNRTTLIALAFEAVLLLIAIVYMWRYKKHPIQFTQNHIISLVCAVSLTFLLAQLTADGWRWVGDYLGDRYFDINQYTQAEHTSFKARLFLWYNSLYMIRDHLLLGVGFGNWTVFYPFYTGNYSLVTTMMTNNPASTILYKQAHNEYVQLVAEIGLIGACWMLLCLVLWICGVGRLIHRAHNTPFLWCWLLLVIAIAGLSVSAMASFPFRVSVPLMVLACYLAILHYFVQQQTSLTTLGMWRWLSTVVAFRVTIPAVAAWSIALFCLLGALFIGTTYNKWIEAHTYRNLSASYLLGGKTDKALELIKKSIAINPADPDDGYYILGNLYKRKKLYSQAIETYNRAFSISLPYHPYMFTQLHLAHLLNKQPQKAIDTLKRAIDIMPMQDGYYAYLGSLYGSLGRAQEAVNYYTQTLQINPKHPKADQMKQIIARHNAAKQR